jgi:hypothetical protein
MCGEDLAFNLQCSRGLYRVTGMGSRRAERRAASREPRAEEEEPIAIGIAIAMRPNESREPTMDH